jgi:hypothetical protein
MKENAKNKTYKIEFAWDQIDVSSLSYHSFNGNVKDVEAAISGGINWETETHLPLYYATLNGKTEIAKALLAARSPVHPSVLHAAYRFGNNQMVTLLLREHHEAFINCTDGVEEFSNLLLDAVRNNDMSVVKTILELGVNIKTVDYFHGFPGWTAFHHAANNCNVEMMKLLSEKGAPIHTLTEEGFSALFLAGTTNPTITPEQRKKSIQFLRRANCSYSPSIAWLPQFLLSHFGKGAYSMSDHTIT